MKNLSPLVLLLGIAGAGAAQAAPVEGMNSPDRIPGQYIVVLKNYQQLSTVSVDIAAAHGANVMKSYGHAINGFSAKMSDAEAKKLANDPRVAVVEADRIIRLNATQTPATWGLDRSDQRALPLDNSYTYNTTAANVNVYVIDTGIRTTHNEFAGRAQGAFTAITDGNGTNDCNGHGTHVAGTIGSGTYGIAKATNLFAVRVLDCAGSGTTSGVISGIDWVTANHVAPSVANMSLGGGISTALDTAVDNSIAAGVTYAVAAGNSNADACNASPARVAAALTVGSSTITDARSSFSNFGTCVDVFAPGSSITSTWNTSDTATNTISGTSMASPHVAGIAALYLAANPTATPAQVKNAVITTATSGVLTGVGTGSPNLLAYSLLTTGGGGGGGGGGTTCPAGYETLSGSLTGTGDYQYQPGGTYYYSIAGAHNGILKGPASTDFDLYLWKWSSASGWVTVGSSLSPTSDESISYSGSSGYYVWRVESYSGAGSYSFCLKRP